MALAAGLLAAAGQAHAQTVLRSPYTPATHQAFNTVKSHAVMPFSRIRRAGRRPRRITLGTAAMAETRRRLEGQFPRTEHERVR